MTRNEFLDLVDLIAERLAPIGEWLSPATQWIASVTGYSEETSLNIILGAFAFICLIALWDRVARRKKEERFKELYQICKEQKYNNERYLQQMRDIQNSMGPGREMNSQQLRDLQLSMYSIMRTLDVTFNEVDRRAKNAEIELRQTKDELEKLKNARRYKF